MGCAAGSPSLLCDPIRDAVPLRSDGDVRRLSSLGSASARTPSWRPRLGFLRRRLSASLRSTSSPIEAWRRRRRSPPPHATRPHSVPPSLSSRCSRLDQPAAARGCDASMPKMAFQSSSRDSFTGAAYAAIAINDSLSPLQHLG